MELLRMPKKTSRTSRGKARIAPRGAGVMVTQKEGTIDKDGDTVKADIEEEADAEDDVVKPSWTRHAPSLPCLKTRHR